MSASEMRQFGQLVVTGTRESLVVNFNCTAILDEVGLNLVGQDLMRVVNLASELDMPFVLSFRGVQAISSALIGKLVLLNKRAKASGVTWHMCDMSPNVAEVFRRLGPGDGGIGVFAKLKPPPKNDGGRVFPPTDHDLDSEDISD